MLQALLKERFHLDAHLEKKDLPVYNLVVMNGGPKIQPTDPERPFHQPVRMPGASSMIVNPRGTMETLATMLTGPTGRPVLNKTNLEGPYFYAPILEARYQHGRP